MKPRETTLDNIQGITLKRRDGNTTRLVDNAIQILFKGKICVCLDHKDMGSDLNANRNLFKRVLTRLKNEFDITSKNIITDSDEFEIELLNEDENRIIWLSRCGNLEIEGKEYIRFEARLIKKPTEKDKEFIGSLRPFFAGAFSMSRTDEKTMTIVFKRDYDIDEDVLLSWVSASGGDYDNFLLQVSDFFNKKNRIGKI